MSFRLTPAMAAELRLGRSPVVPLVEVELPAYTLRHLVGAGELLWNGKLFTGVDDRFGSLIAAGTLKDGVADEAPDWDITFCPPDSAAVADLTAATAQGGDVRAWLAVVDRASGQVVPEPLQLFAGELDVARLRVGENERTVEWRCTSALEVFHDQEIGAKLSHGFHQLVWPGENGLANMTGIERTSYWGVEKPPSGVSLTPDGALRASFLSSMGL